MSNNSNSNEPTLSDAVRADLVAQMEWVTQAVVMLDPRDLPSMAKLAKGLRGIAAMLPARAAGDVAVSAPASEQSAGDLGNCRDAALSAAKRIESIILEESANPDGDLAAVSQTVSALQAFLCYNRPERFPDELPAGGGQEATGEKSGEAAGSPPPPSGRTNAAVVDDELFAAFIAQEQMVLPEIEETILSYEKSGELAHLATLRRIIHTMKGEAGVCGIPVIATACHQLEDYLEPGAAGVGQRAVSADVLFGFTDWLEMALLTCESGKTPEGLGDLLAPRAADEMQAGPAAAPPEQSKTEPGPAAPAAAAEAAAPGESDVVIIRDRELAADFVGEAQEHFDAADENLLRLETDPTNKDAIGAVFRAFHTIKGVSGFIGLTPIGELAHAAETLLDDVRKGRHMFRGAVVDVTFRALDMLKQMLADLSAALKAGCDMPVRDDLPGMLKHLHRVREGAAAAPGGEEGPAAAEVRQASAGAGGSEAPEARLPEGDAAADAGADAQAGKGSVVAKQTMKVETEKIDLLLDTIGELVITETIVAEAPEIKGLQSHRVERLLAQLSKITRSLQDMGMAMRMVPVESTFRKMARLVRDLAIKSGKQVEFAMEGQETEIDKGMIEKLGDPLVHMVRNSMDHGLESAQDRVAKGKPATGHLTLRAFHHGGSIHIQIVDDGRGLDRDAIFRKGVEKGLIPANASLSDQDVFALIFEAGFSTAKQVTEISGRGVGMDVVRRNVDALRGKVLIQSTPGKGSVFTIVLPLTMAIIDGMQVRVGQEVFVIPTLSIVEVFNPAPGSISTVTGKGEMILFRNSLLPLYRMASLFNVTSATAGASTQIVVVVEDSGRQIGFVVEELLGQQQTVIKNLGVAMGTVPGISGASIMADGRPGLIVDVAGVVKLGHG
jgi:two-component system chemotaxis sensor kinase CheA